MESLKENTSYIVERILSERELSEIAKRKQISELEGYEHNQPKDLLQINVHKATEKAYLNSERANGECVRWVDKDWFHSRYIVFEEIGNIELINTYYSNGIGCKL